MQNSSRFNASENHLSTSTGTQMIQRFLPNVGLAAVMILLAMSQESTVESGHLQAINARKPMPDLVLSEMGGGNWRLQDQRGKVVLINFWATWCPPCRQETPGLAKLARDYQSKGLAVVGISLDEGGPRAVQSFVNEFHLPYPIAMPAQSSPLTSEIESLPTTLLIDRHGRVAKTYTAAVSESTFKADVERLISEG
jgi:cytochrome c biogenesis protein CcmG, thiol:disulfide interchange protein DsbE